MISILGLAVQLFNGLSGIGKLVAVGSLLVALAAGYGTWHYHVWSNGYDKAINDIAAQDKKAIEAGKTARSRYRECVDSGLRWDTTTGQCSRR